MKHKTEQADNNDVSTDENLAQAPSAFTSLFIPFFFQASPQQLAQVFASIPVRITDYDELTPDDERDERSLRLYR